MYLLQIFKPMILGEYYQFFIGSVTLDVYETLESGIVHILDPSHGYHRTNIYLATRFPRVATNNQELFSIFPKSVWLAVILANALFIIMIFNSVMIYEKVNNTLVRRELEWSQLLVRLVAGFTEPDNENWFTKFSTGKCLMLLWSVSAFFLISIFTMDLRSKLIVPEMEKPIDTIQDIDFTCQKILFDYGIVNMTYTIYTKDGQAEVWQWANFSWGNL